MKLKHRPGDFRVEEILAPGYLQPRGRFRVYRVTKRKRTSLEAAAALAGMTGVASADVGIAGLKDRQGVTTQFMSVPGGRMLRLRTPDLSIEAVGFAAEGLASRHSEGNAFEVIVRGLARQGVERLSDAAIAVREHGFPNYFGEQRFGNLRHGQGWIARDLALGRHEPALRRLLASASEGDDPKSRRFKAAIAARWGDWRACREIAGAFGKHHSVFEHLAKHPGDFAGAFRRVASRLRLIHLYAWQSHLWNRAVSRYVEEITAPADRILLPSVEGRLAFSRGRMGVDPAMANSFRLPGPRLEDVQHPRQRELLTAALALESLAPEDFAIEGVPGFQLKGEDRALIVHARDLRFAAADRTRTGAASEAVRIRFSLPRGSYALLLVHRLLAGARGPRPAGSDTRSRGPRPAAAETRSRGPRPTDAETRSRGPRPRNAETRSRGPGPAAAETRARERRSKR